jgi:hypothetical protein
MDDAPYSEDIRERALAPVDAGETVHSIAEALQISLPRGRGSTEGLRKTQTYISRDSGHTSKHSMDDEAARMRQHVQVFTVRWVAADRIVARCR